MKDSYKTIVVASEETLFKEKGSKFFGYAFPVSNKDEIKSILAHLRKRHPNAGHFCYAWQLGFDPIRFRVNDDGEPNNSAGLPIYGQIQSFQVTNILVVSVRYFGGTKLGVGGLIAAYKKSAQFALEASEILEKTINVQFKLTFNYDLMNSVMRIVKEKQIDIIYQKLEVDCTYIISVRKKHAKNTYQIFDTLYKVVIKEMV